MQKMNWQYKTDLEKAGLKVVKLLQSQNFQAFWVGGVVRNMLLKRESDNIDIATDATPDEIEDVLNRAKIVNKPVGKQFGSILAIVKGWKIEITTFRAEGRYSDKRHPDEVTYIRAYIQDAARRDFTINALYFDPVKKIVYDPVNGISNLESRILKFVGDPKKRLEEDALRMLRGVRLATQLGFKLERNSFAAIKTRAKYIQGISGERIKAEFDKILLSPNRVEGLRLLDQIGLLRFIIPEIEPLKLFSHQSRKYHLEGDMFKHTLFVIVQAPSDNLDILYTLLFHDIGKPESKKRVWKPEGWVISAKGHPIVSARIFREFAQRLGFPREQRELIEWLILNHEIRPFAEANDQDQAWRALDLKFELLPQVWLADFRGNIRADLGDTYSKEFSHGMRLARDMIQRVKKSQKLIARLAQGDLLMKLGNLKPSRELGKKIQDIKIQIVLGKIKNLSDLKKWLDKREQ